MSNKEKKFIELTEKRMNKTIKQLRLIGNLSNRSNYTYSQTQANKIVARLNSELNNIKHRFSNGRNSVKDLFKL